MRRYRNFVIAAAVVTAPTGLLAATPTDDVRGYFDTKFARSAPAIIAPTDRWAGHRNSMTPATVVAQQNSKTDRKHYQAAKQNVAKPTAATSKTEKVTASRRTAPPVNINAERKAKAVVAVKNRRGAPLSAIADSIHVRFQGFKDLNGIYRLNEDETVSIPGVGRLSIVGLTASDLEKALAKHIMGSTGRLAPVSVEVSSYRHVFVDGIVSRPGS